MGLLGKLFGQPQVPVETGRANSATLPADLIRALAELPDWLLINPSSNPPAQTAAMDADFDLYMKWEAFFHSACIGNCLFAVGAMRGLSETQKGIAMQRVLSDLEKSITWHRPLVTRFMDYLVPTLDGGASPELAIGAWLLGALAAEPSASSEIIEMSQSPEMLKLHGSVVMDVTRQWAASLRG
jgi:hypothetical protein